MVDEWQDRIIGPLAPHAHGFGTELGRQGYTRRSVRAQLWLVANLSRWLSDEGLSAEALTPVVVDRFVVARREAGYQRPRGAKAMDQLLVYLHTLGVVPSRPAASMPVTAADVLLERYRRYLTVERGLTEGTARGYVDKVRAFLVGRDTGGSLDLEHLAAGDIVAFILAKSPGMSQGAAKLLVTSMRSLLGFLHVDGQLEVSLTAAVPSVAGWRLAGLPRALEPGQVRCLLASCDRRTTKGRRDFAILTLMARLGLRCGEVARLELDDVDWRASELIIRGKGNRQERLPLPVDVGEAVAAYLQRGRPSSAQGRCVFVRVMAPHRSLTPGGLGQVAVMAGRRAGIGSVASHRLRHTAATEMLRAGASLTEIAQVLRHRSLQNTAIYAKVDREALRSLARPWAGSGGAA